MFIAGLVFAGCGSSGHGIPDAGMDGSLSDAAVDGGSTDAAMMGGKDGGAKDGGPSDGGPSDASVATGCPTLGPGSTECSLELGAMTRTYLVHVPPSYDGSSATPLVVNFHGITMTSTLEQFFTAMNAKADSAGFIVVYPQGVSNSWNAGQCCIAGVDDVGFARALVADLEAKAHIDPQRIYATGFSNGGMLTHRLACEASDLFAAFAPVSGAYVLPASETCAPARGIPIIAFHGAMDPIIPYDGGGSLSAPSIPDTMQGWADRDHCTTGPTPTFDNGMAHCETWSGCDDGAKVVLCTIDDMGHCWPGSAAASVACPMFMFLNTALGNGSSDISANDQMWTFFQQFPLP